MHRILVIGVGSIGERHARCLLRTKRAEVGICEPNEKVRLAAAERCGIASSYVRLEDALERPWDAAVVATPANLHISISQTLAQAGINLLIEKPLSTSQDGIDKLIDAVAANGLKAGVAYVYRAHPVLAAMRQALASGRFGRPVQLVAVAGQHFPTFRPAYREIYYARRASGGGAIQDALTHIINAAQWLVGPVTRLSADAAHQVLDGVEVEDVANIVARHGDVLASYSLNQYQAPSETTITVICQGGTLRFEVHENRWRWMTQPSSPWHDEPHPPMERDDWFTFQEHAFLDCLEGKAAPLCSLAEGRQTLAVNLAALKSADEGCVPIELH